MKSIVKRVTSVLLMFTIMATSTIISYAKDYKN